VRAALAVAATLAAFAWAGDLGAFCRTTTSRARSSVPGECVTSGIPLGWRSRCTGYSLYRGEVPAEIPFTTLETITRESTSAWARVPCDQDGRGVQYFRVLPNAPTWNLSGYNPQGANSNTVSFRHRWGDNAIHRAGTIAITIVTFDSYTGEIFDADIELNTYDEASNRDGFRFSTATTNPDPGTADLQTILTHEFGHFMGLSHSSNDRAVMWPEAGLGEIRRTLTADDALGMCTIYPESRTPDTRCLAVPYGGLTTQPGTVKVLGANDCAVSPGSVASPRALTGWLVLAGVGVLTRRRRRM